MKKNQTLVTTAVVVALGAAAYYFLLRPGAGKGGGNRGGNSELDQKMLPIANNLFDAMNGYGTNEGDIQSELKKLKSKEEWDALVRAFGTRTISSGNWNVFQSDFTGGLVECLYSELGSSDINSVNQILSKIGVSI